MSAAKRRKAAKKVEKPVQSRSGRNAPLRRLGAFYLFFSLCWVAALGAYFYSYQSVLMAREMPLSANSWVIWVFLVIVPLIALWGPYYLQVLNERAQADHYLSAQDAQYEFGKLSKSMEKVRQMTGEIQELQNQLATDLLPHLGARVASKIKPNERRDESAQSDPSLPLATDMGSNGQKVDLRDMAVVLNFSDVQSKGDWANSFAQVAQNEKRLEFVRLTEDVLEVFEEEGIFVEDIAIRPASGAVWQSFARGERDESTKALAGVRDPSVLALVRARLRNDTKFQDLALNFQKRFIAMIEELAEDADDEDFAALNKSRGGRLFAILGQISGVF